MEKPTSDDGVYGSGSSDHANDLVANRAKAIGVLRKAEEFVTNQDPPEPLRALELAAGRCGVKYDEYRAMIESDVELAKLEQVFLQRQ